MLTKADIAKLDMIPPKDGSARLFPLQKILFESDQGTISFCITVQRGSPETCLRLPDDSVLYLGGISSLEDVEILMELITDYQGNYEV